MNMNTCKDYGKEYSIKLLHILLNITLYTTTMIAILVTYIVNINNSVELKIL